MTISMSARFSEWNRRMKDNKKLRKFLNEDYLNQEPEDETEDPDFDDREDVKAIENSIKVINASVFKPGVPQKVKFMKNQTFPKISFCKICSKDIYSCTCKKCIALTKSIEENINKLNKTSPFLKPSNILEIMEILNDDKQLINNGDESIIIKNKYTFKKSPPSMSEILESQTKYLNETIYQELVLIL